MIRVVFLGTPAAAVPTLAGLVSRYDVGLVVTQPDRPRGRSRKPAPSAVKLAARERGLLVAQPESSSEIVEVISEHGPFDLGVVVAYGRVLSPEVLEMPGAGLLNVHFSLLPRWRGAAPVARALIAGDTMTGVTIIKIDEGLDTGPVLTAQAVDIAPEEDAGRLTERLAVVGGRLTVDQIPGFLSGTVTPVPQRDEGVTYAAKLTAADRPLNLDGSAQSFVAKVRGLSPTPGAVLGIDGEPHRVLAARPHDHAPSAGYWQDIDGSPVVAVGDGGVEIVTLQPPGKRPMDGAAWLRGLRVTSGRVD